MNPFTTLPITEARKKIFAIAKSTHAAPHYYTLTEHGRPKVVVVSAKRFASLLEKEKRGLFTQSVHSQSSIAADRPPQTYQGNPFFAGYVQNMILRDRQSDLSYDRLQVLHNEKELAKAQLYITLMEQYGYPMETIQLGQYVRVGGVESRRYIEADLIVDDILHNRVLIFAVSARKVYAHKNETVFRDLFEVARAFSFTGDKRVYLIHHTRLYNKKTVIDKNAVVDFMGHKSYATWKKNAQKYEKDLPCYEGA